MNDRLTGLVQHLVNGSWRDLERDAWNLETKWVEMADPDELRALCAVLDERLEPPVPEPEAEGDRLLLLVQRMTGAVLADDSETVLDQESLSHISLLYRRLRPTLELLAGQLLQLVGTARGAAAEACLIDLLIEAPPSDPHAVALAMSALFRYDSATQQRFFPRLLAAIEHLSVASPILDLANYLYREKGVRPHPAADRATQLATLLGQLADRLDRIAEQPDEVADSAQALSRLVADSVSLGVSLCDALALIGDRSVIGKIYRALDVEHRRLQTEAAWALAKLDEEVGRERLQQLASEPVVRLRVLYYADELDLLDSIDEQYRTEVARAEAGLAAWLAEPTQFGLAPHRIELVDEREMYWPGYDEPQACFLFRFGYDLFESPYSNIGISGPLTHAFAVDLADLPPDDIYAVFAGYGVQHDGLRHVPADQATGTWAVTRDRLARRIEEHGYTAVEPRLVADFFGEEVLVAQCRRKETEGLAVADLREVQWRAVDTPRALGPQECFYLYVGKKLLKAFN